MTQAKLTRAALGSIEAHARETYPEECCGLVLAIDGREEVRRITNIQNRFHADDPETHPRDARIAYFMEPGELAAALRDSERPGASIRLFYHSHPDHDAYFSEEDKAAAMPFGEPSWPEAQYLVISVREGKVGVRLLVTWDHATQTYAEHPLTIED